MGRSENESRKFARITRLVQKRHRIFAELERQAGTFPSMRRCAGDAVNDVTVWCSNHYLGMGPHPTVIAAVHEALDRCGVGAGRIEDPVVIGSHPLSCAQGEQLCACQ